ncbi:Fe-only nitrogenase accessory protein AnfO [Clostridium tyrobutyricum]|uniref:Fe-only nitrogenase accessory protein AnfO n=1 Tax=Clostridium tyrobutyricum TaxID=1519 RepID=UPI001C3891D5|nr:Fe-only nitrogenase accessory protein AnfO [Clostridium tyrobutyricum]MBV4419580.1 Fe-only nitrogenase accessory protein AnfO [Clostridium tyrobutyricum]
MKDQIAVLVNNSGEIGSFLQSGVVNIYINKNQSWIIKDKVEFDINNISDMNSLRSNIIKLVENLGKCKIFVAEKVSGILYNILERNGITSWEINGNPYDCLDYVYKRELAEDKRLLLESIKPKDNIKQWIIKDDESCNYSLDLVEMQNKNPDITSKQALMPFIENTVFSKLIIYCSHIPMWFKKEFDTFNLKFDIQEKKKNKFKIIVTPK